MTATERIEMVFLGFAPCVAVALVFFGSWFVKPSAPDSLRWAKARGYK